MDMIFRIIAGSRMYGTHNENSDYDYRGIFMPEYNSYFKFNQKDVIESNSNGEDIVYYSIRKFVKLAMANNPNIIEWLYAPEENIVEISPAGKALMEMKFRLLNKRYIRDRFTDFSTSEMYKYNNDNRKLKSIALCTRVLYEGIELLQHGSLTFPRPEASLLLDIRNGLVSHEDITNNIKFLREEINYEYNECKFLPDITNNEIIESEMVEIIKKHTRR